MIRELTLADLDWLANIEQELFTSYWKKEDFKTELTTNQFAKYFVIYQNDQPAGYVGVWLLYEQAQITTIGVCKKFQKMGLGAKLLQHVIKYAQENGGETISLEVRVSNQPAINLYQKLGFSVINIRKNYYSDNHEDAYLMMKGI